MVVTSPTIGILGYQGCIEPHEQIYARLGIPTVRVRTPQELLAVDRLILPGGESTTMLRFIQLHGMVEPLQAFASTRPTWGICAGSILLAKEVVNPSQLSLGAINITAHRNFYGPQIESFTSDVSIDLLDKPIEVQFIRAPRLVPNTTTGSEAPVTVHARLNDQSVFLSQGKTWACAFHVELGHDSRLHELFASI